MKIKKTNIPEYSLIKDISPLDYADSYVCTTQEAHNISADDLMVSFWTKMPPWVDALFKLRNLLVKPFGLESKRGSVQEFEQAIRTGSNYGFISFPAKSEHETIMCMDDKHLKAYLSVYIEELNQREKTIYLTTLVQFHKKLGYFYFYIIYPFHHLIVKNLVKYTIKNLNRNDKNAK